MRRNLSRKVQNDQVYEQELDLWERIEVSRGRGGGGSSLMVTLFKSFCLVETELVGGLEGGRR